MLIHIFGVEVDADSLSRIATSASADDMRFLELVFLEWIINPTEALESPCRFFAEPQPTKPACDGSFSLRPSEGPPFSF